MQRRFARSRPGSVLILVVALLVLMALIGTAYITMAQSDRYASQQNQYNTQIDLLVQSVINLVKGTVTQDLFVNGQYRPAGTTYKHYTGVGPDDMAAARTVPPTAPRPNAGTWWLGDRLPAINNIAVAPTASNGNNPPYWRYITGPLNGSNFESPVQAGNVRFTFNRDLPLALAGGLNARWVPTTYTTVSGQVLPAFYMMDANGNVRPDLLPVIAADADGDGIADSCLYRLPVGTMNGITYYAAVRIVDNLAALNVNTAYFPQQPPTGAAIGAVPPGDFFPTNIDLASLLINAGGSPDNPNGLNTLNLYRFGNTAGPQLSVYDDNGLIRTDFLFGTQLEASWMQLGRRLQNPGVGASTSGPIRYSALGVTDSMKLAYKFVLRNSSLTPSVVEQALFHSTNDPRFVPDQPYLPQNAAAWFRNNFFFANPNILQPNGVPLRSILVARNPVSSFAPSRSRLRGSQLPDRYGNEYQFGDMVEYPAANGRALVYVGPPPLGAVQYTVSPPTGVTPLNPFQLPLFQPLHAYSALGRWYWAVMPWTSGSTKVSVNTGTFDQLRVAYYNVLSDPTTTSGVPAGTEFRQLYSPIRDPNQWWPGGAAFPVAWRPQRPVARTFLSSQETAKLRGALAAVNTMGLRQGNRALVGATFNIVSRKIVLGAFVPAAVNANPPVQSYAAPASPISNRLVEATVYSTAPQPFITRVYAENDNVNKNPNDTKGLGPNPQGYVGVELYNPYPYDIDLTNWSVAIVQGRTPYTGAATGPQFPNMVVTSLAKLTGGGVVGTQQPIVPAMGYLVLENYNDVGAPKSPLDALHRPQIVDPVTNGGTVPKNLKYFYVPGLQQVMQDSANPTAQPGGELVLMRPRQSQLDAGSLTGSGAALTLRNHALTAGVDYNENQIYDLVPADSFDFYGMQVLPQNASTPFTGIYYHRFQDPSPQNNWKFVYPGHWDATGTLPGGPPMPFHQEGTKPGTWPPTSNDVQAMTPLGVQAFGTPGPSSFLNNFFPPIQLNNQDMAGPLAPTGGFGNTFPYGGFARNGDILQVPFIGSYRLRLLAMVSPGIPQITAPTFQPTLQNAASPQTVLELNPVTMDAQQADDYDSYPNPGLAASPRSDDMAENIGRFCPIAARDFSPTGVLLAGQIPPVDDLRPAPAPASGLSGSTANRWSYHWANQLFDYLTVDSPQDAQVVNEPIASDVPSITPVATIPGQGINHTSSSTAAPQTYGRVTSLSGAGSVQAAIDLSSAVNNYTNDVIMFLDGPAQGQVQQITSVQRNAPNNWTIRFAPVQGITGTTTLTGTLAPTQNSTFVVLATPEETAPTDGLVNVNTASWRVLAAVPFVPNMGNLAAPALRNTAAVLNFRIAYSIVYYRDIDDGSGASPPHGHGPFATLDELNAVPLLESGPPVYTIRDAINVAYGGGSSRSRDFTTPDGDLSPFNPSSATGDGVVGDFEGSFLLMNRVSNMLTTRSDSFTVYVVIQGWRDAETPNPTLAVQRRAAFILDRSVVTPANPSPSIVPIPTD